MTGTLKVIGNVYYTYINYVDENGKRQQKTRSTGLPTKGNKGRANAILDERKQAIAEELQRRKQPNSAVNIRFSDWVRQWQEDAKRQLELSTYEGYDINTRNHILPYFDAQGTMLADVTRPVLQDFIDYESVHGRRDGKSGPLAPKTVRHIRNVLQWANGIPFAPDFVSQKFPELLKKHGLRHIRFHDLRHSCASFLLANGFNLKDAQEWLGHSDIATTANVYAHLDMGRKREIANGFIGKFTQGTQG